MFVGVALALIGNVTINHLWACVLPMNSVSQVAYWHIPPKKLSWTRHEYVYHTQAEKCIIFFWHYSWWQDCTRYCWRQLHAL